MSFRILPLTIMMALLALGLKVVAIVHDGHAFISESVAEEPSASKEAEKDKEKEVAAVADKDKAKETEKESENAKDKDKEEPAKEAAAGEDKGHGDAKDKQAKDGDAKDKEGAGEVTLPQMGCDAGKTFSQTEIDVLQSLSKRREELDARAKELQMREDLIKAAEMKVDGKIGELKGLKDQLEKLLAEYKQMEDAEIKSLVKIYENMKPKDAAAIFEELDMATLLRVVERMKEAKAAPVLAAMTPERAKELTVRLAEHRKLPEQINAAGSAAPAGKNDGTAPVNLKPLPNAPASLPPAKQ